MHFAAWDWKFQKSSEGMSEKIKARKQLLEVMAHRSRVDNSVDLIGGSLFEFSAPRKAPKFSTPSVRPATPSGG